MVVSLSEKLSFIESIFGKGKLSKNAKNFDVRCPICNPSDPTKKKLAIYVPNDMCHCWTCGYKAISLAPLIHKYARHRLAEYKQKFYKGRKSESEIQDEQTVILPADFKLLVTSDTKETIAIKNYLRGRNITERDLWKYKIGYSTEDRWSRRVIVPSFDSEGTLNYFIARSIDKHKKPKYDCPEVKKNTIIFNEVNINWSKPVILCEGVFDAIACGDNSIPLLGSDINENSKLFSALIVNKAKVYLALDGDMWYTKTPLVAKKLMSYDIDVKIVDTRSFSDPASAERDQLQSAIKNATQMNWRDTFSQKLYASSSFSLTI